MKRLLIVMFIFATAANASAQSTVDYVENQSVIAGSPSVNVVGLSSKTRFISNEVIKETVENSIKKAELFSGGENKVRVNLTILNIEIPFIGLNGTAEIRIRWQLISDDDKSFIFQSEIFSDHRKFLNRPRATRKTIDVALKKNIRLALEEISNEISAIEEFDRELNAEQLFEKKDSTYEVSSNKPFTGVSVEYYKNGQLKEKTFYRGGKENGPYQAHHESGKLMGRGTYKDGKLIGAFETFYENGRLWFKVLYDDGKQVSREMYHEDGQKVSL